MAFSIEKQKFYDDEKMGTLETTEIHEICDSYVGKTKTIE